MDTLFCSFDCQTAEGVDFLVLFAYIEFGSDAICIDRWLDRFVIRASSRENIDKLLDRFDIFAPSGENIQLKRFVICALNRLVLKNQ